MFGVDGVHGFGIARALILCRSRCTTSTSGRTRRCATCQVSARPSTCPPVHVSQTRLLARVHVAAERALLLVWPVGVPLAFFGGHAYGDKTYTNGADRDEIVAPKFRETMFEVMGGVRELVFTSLKWGDEGIKALAVVLPLCGQLTVLTLSGNEIGPEGARAIGEWLRDNRSLTELNLGVNKIGAEGAKALADALRVNEALTFLDVRRNGLDVESEALLRDAVKDKSGFELGV